MNQQENLVGAVFQATAFFISLFCMGLLLTASYTRFTSYDPIEQLLPNEQAAQSITTGIHVTHFNKFKVQNNQFEMHGMIWFAYDPKLVPIDIIKKFSIANGQILQLSEPKITTHEHETIAQFKIYLSFYCPLDYRIFPFDDHRIVISIINDFLPKDMVLQSSVQDMTIDKTLYIPGWNIIDMFAQTGCTKTELERSATICDVHQKASFVFLCQRNDPSIAVNILLTLILLLFMSLLTFSSPEDSVLIVSVAMVALIGYRVVMQTMGPEHISYFIFSDYLYLFSLIGSIMAIFGGIFTRERNSPTRTKKLAIIAIYALYIISSTIVTFVL